MSRSFSNKTIEVPFYVYAFKVDGKRRLAWSDSKVTDAYIPFCRKDHYDLLIEENNKLREELAKLKHANNMERVEIGNLTAQKIIQKIDYKDEITKLKTEITEFRKTLKICANYAINATNGKIGYDSDAYSSILKLVRDILVEYPEEEIK